MHYCAWTHSTYTYQYHEYEYEYDDDDSDSDDDDDHDDDDDDVFLFTIYNYWNITFCLPQVSIAVLNLCCYEWSSRPT